MSMEDLAAEDLDVEDIGVDMPSSESSQTANDGGDSGKSFFTRVKEVMTRSTGRGDLEGYRQKPLCFDDKESTARIVRGIEGVAKSDSNFWWVDVLMGYLERQDLIPNSSPGETTSNEINENIAK